MEPLTRLVKDNTKFEWKEEQWQAFDIVNAKYLEVILLVYSKTNEFFTNTCDM